jgi:hypothetical protein
MHDVRPVQHPQVNDCAGVDLKIVQYGCGRLA